MKLQQTGFINKLIFVLSTVFWDNPHISHRFAKSVSSSNNGKKKSAYKTTYY